MALYTMGKHYTPVWQKIQEAIDSQHVRSMPPRVWQGAVGRAGHQEVSLSKGESPRTQTGFCQVNSDGQSASLRLLFPHYSKRERAAPTRASVGPRADQMSTVLRGYAEGRYGHLSRVCGERR